jgi:hypothetical protein
MGNMTEETMTLLARLSEILLELESNDEIPDDFKESVETLNGETNTLLGH